MKVNLIHGFHLSRLRARTKNGLKFQVLSLNFSTTTTITTTNTTSTVPKAGARDFLLDLMA